MGIEARAVSVENRWTISVPVVAINPSGGSVLNCHDCDVKHKMLTEKINQLSDLYVDNKRMRQALERISGWEHLISEFNPADVAQEALDRAGKIVCERCGREVEFQFIPEDLKPWEHIYCGYCAGCRVGK